MADGGEDFDLGQVVGSDGRGITNIAKTGTSGLTDTYTITYSDGTTSTFIVKNGATGATGADGRGISSISKTGTSGLVDTYTITYSDNTTSTFAVTNGSNATVDIVTAWNSTTSDSKVPSEKLVKNSLPTKTSDLTNDGDGTNVFIKNNDSRLTDTRNPKVNTVNSNATGLDLDNYNTQAGLFYFYNSSYVGDIAHIPTSLGNKAFYLFVERYTNNFVKQTLTRYTDGKMWVRVRDTVNNVAVWSSWEEIATKDYVDTLVGSAISYINQ